MSFPAFEGRVKSGAGAPIAGMESANAGEVRSPREAMVAAESFFSEAPRGFHAADSKGASRRNAIDRWNILESRRVGRTMARK